MSWFSIPVRLSGSDPASPSVPLWGAIGALGVPILITTILVGVLLKATVSGWAPFILFGLAGVLAAFVFAAVKQNWLKQAKILLDISWNVWTYVGVSFLFYVSVDHSHQRLDAALGDAGLWIKVILFFVVCATAGGRVAIPLAELLHSIRQSSSG